MIDEYLDLSYIDSQMKMRMKFAKAGLEIEDNNRWMKAFRLKHFDLCPKCGKHFVWHDSIKFNTRVAGCNCGFGIEITHAEFITGDLDEMILGIVDEWCFNVR